MSLKLSDVQSRKVIANIESPDGYKISVTIGTLSYVEWNNCAMGVEFPSIPTIRMATDKGLQDVFNHNDPSYRNDLAIAEGEVVFRRVVASLAKGGDFPELQGKPLDEQVRLAQDMDVSVIEGVMQVLGQIKRHTKGSVDAQKATFQDEQVSE